MRRQVPFGDFSEQDPPARLRNLRYIVTLQAAINSRVAANSLHVDARKSRLLLSLISKSLVRSLARAIAHVNFDRRSLRRVISAALDSRDS